jgi:hypothetical protein
LVRLEGRKGYAKVSYCLLGLRSHRQLSVRIASPNVRFSTRPRRLAIGAMKAATVRFLLHQENLEFHLLRDRNSCDGYCGALYDEK